MYYVYMLRCRGDTLYTGLTNDVSHRMRCHVGLLRGGAKYTRSHPPEKLEALWRTEGKTEAARLECAIKRLTRREKEQLLVEPDALAQLSGAPCIYLPDVTLQDCLKGELFHGE